MTALASVASGRSVRGIPVTRIKIFLASFLYFFLHLFLRRNERIIVRRGIKYKIDLSEGIDLSLFIFGNFQRHVVENALIPLEKESVIVDVGANSGVMTLQFAQRSSKGHVFAFEPTTYAYTKLTANLALNPELAARVTPLHAFVSSVSGSNLNIEAYSSWKVTGTKALQRHPVHGGTAHSTDGAPTYALDDFLFNAQIQRLDLIKIDTDGHELEVLKGARRALEKFHPAIVFEVGLYLLSERNIPFTDYLRFFGEVGYIVVSQAGRVISEDNFDKLIPKLGTIDAVAVPADNNRAIYRQVVGGQSSQST